jgi:hypothetical protein
MFRQYNHFVLASIQFVKCLALFVEPGLNALFVTEANSPTEWRIVFFVHAALLIVAAFGFIFFVSDKPAEFTKDAIVDEETPEKPPITEKWI